MTKNELKEALEKALQDGDLDTEWFSMMQDASIHAALILGIELPIASAAYATQCIGHIVMTNMFGQDISLEDLLKGKSGSESKPRTMMDKPKMTEQERKTLETLIPPDIDLNI